MGSCCSIAAQEEEKTGGEAERGFAAFIERICAALGTWPALALAFASLAASFAMSKAHCCGAGAAGLATPAWIAVAICGSPLLREAVDTFVLHGRIKPALLISCAMVSCLAIGQVFAAGEVAFLMALGEALEKTTLKRARRGVSKLVSLVPKTARYVVTCPKCRAKGEFFRDVSLSSLEIGDGVRILPGETIPVDGKVVEGETTVDESTMTGESLPADKKPGDPVYSGTVNRFGAITVETVKKDEDSSLQKLVRLVKEASRKKAPVQRIADKWAAILVPAALAVAAAVFFAAWAWTGSFQTGLVRGVTIMVVFCPCSLALATPTAIMAAIGQASKYGVIVKSGEALENMGRVDTVCFDKTGTITEGRLSASCAVAYRGSARDPAPEAATRVMALAASVESSSEHPLAKAIAAAGQGAGVEPCEGFSMKPGRGVRGVCGGVEVACGTAGWLAENGVAVPEEARKDADLERAEGKAAVFVSAGGVFAGYIALSDSPREAARETVAALGREGVETCLLTGDHEATARHVASMTGIAAVEAELLPGEKAGAVERMEKSGRRVCMVGDGVNDAVALKTASVGVAMGGAGSDIAVEAADIALVGDDISKIVYLKRLSKACTRLIGFNISLSMAINAVAIVLSALGVLTPVTGAIVHNCGSVFVVLNAALLYDRKYR